MLLKGGEKTIFDFLATTAESQFRPTPVFLDGISCLLR